MRELRRVSLVLAGLFLCLFALANPPVWVAGQLLVKVEDSENFVFPEVKHGEILGQSNLNGFRELIAEFGITKVCRAFKTSSHQLDRIFRIDFSTIENTLQLMERLAAFPFIEYAERVPAHYLQHTPDDLDFRQWHLVKIEAEAAWDYSRGMRKVIVAIVDDAIRIDHQDLGPRIWSNPGEIFGDSIDNDGNGFIDDINGYDVADDDWDVMPPIGSNDYSFGHGTHVAGIAAASTNNSKGIASIGYGVSIMPVKTKHDSTIGSNQLDATVYGVDYAIINGANVINMSFGGTGYSQSFQTLINVGHEKGIVLVGAAGNDGEYRLFYPAGYKNVIMVGSTKKSDVKSGFSNYHPFVDVMAPGSGIRSTAAGEIDNYVNMSGTSMSSPLTAGLCGLVLSLDSTLTPDQVLDCLKSGADNIDSLNPLYAGFMGAGRINARKTLECVLFPVAVDDNPGPQDHLEIFPNPVTDRLQFNGNFSQSGPLKITIFNLQGRTLALPFSKIVNPGIFNMNWEWDTNLVPGLYFVSWEFEGIIKTEKVLVQ